MNKIEYNPHNVELLWGNDNNPESNYPKNVFERIKSSSKIGTLRIYRIVSCFMK